MSDVSHQNHNFHLSKPPHKLSNKHSLVKTKPTKRSPRSNKNKINNTTISNNSNTITFSNTKPLKVVHISNPIKFEVTPTEFLALVQGLTGRDAVVDWSDDHNLVNYQATVGVGVGVGGDGDVDVDGSSDGGVTDDQVVQELLEDIHHDEEAADVSSFSDCFGPSDHHLSFDCFGPFHHDDIDDDSMEEDFRAFMGDH